MSRDPGDWIQRVRLDASVFIAHGAVVVGDVSIGRGSSVWFNAVVRGDTDRIEIGEDTNIQDLTVVHVDEGQPALLGNRITVGHRAVIHGCRIEDDCLIGMGAVVLSGASIGTGSLVGAGALVREGEKVPPGSLVVGAPARVVGPVRDAHREAILRGATHYAALARSYIERGLGQARTSESPRPSRRAE
jgi:carbonic anhydrase/acetyltransferase-like protein (isoleucine patch superfamily)